MMKFREKGIERVSLLLKRVLLKRGTTSFHENTMRRLHSPMLHRTRGMKLISSQIVDVQNRAPMRTNEP